METKVCSKCNTEKPVSDFYMRSGSQVPYPKCKECHNSAPNAAQKLTEITCAGYGGKALKRAGTKYCSSKCRPVKERVMVSQNTGFTVDGMGPRKQLWEIPSAGTWEEKNLRRGKEGGT